jgi:hypothetical protein
MKKICVLSMLTATFMLAGCTATDSATQDSLIVSQEADVVEMYRDAYRNTHGPNRRDATIVAEGGSRGGAALRTVEERHVLYYRYPESTLKNDVVDTTVAIPKVDLLDALNTVAILDGDEGFNQANPSDYNNDAFNGVANPAPSTVDNTTKDVSKSQPSFNSGIDESHGFSHYELSRWERYCAGMPDNLDVKFIKRVGGDEKLPAFMRATCHPKPVL